MKIKNLILGAAATVFAVGGAIASNTSVVGNYVQTSPSCRAIQPVECGMPGNYACMALIDNVSYSVFIARTSANVCTTPVTTVSKLAFESIFLD